MFEPFLACKVFGLTGGSDDLCLNLARVWSRQPNLLPSQDGSIEWDSETRLDIEGDLWRAAPPPMRLKTHSALIPLGYISDVRAVAVISPFPVIAASFREAVAHYVAMWMPKSSVVDLGLSLEGVAGLKNCVIRAVEGISPNGFRVLVRADRSRHFNGVQRLPEWKEFHSIEIEILDHCAKVDRNFNISLDDVSVEYPEIARCVMSLFELFRPVARVSQSESSAAQPRD